MAVLVEVLVFIVIGRSCSEGCGFVSYYRLGSFLRFSRPINCRLGTAPREMRGVASVLKLWPIVETSVMSENDGITVRQTVAHTILLWPHEQDTPYSSRLSRRMTQ